MYSKACYNELCNNGNYCLFAELSNAIDIGSEYIADTSTAMSNKDKMLSLSDGKEYDNKIRFNKKKMQPVKRNRMI